MTAAATYVEAGDHAARTRGVPPRTGRTWLQTLRAVAEAWAEAREMHRAAHKRYPFLDN